MARIYINTKEKLEEFLEYEAKLYGKTKIYYPFFLSEKMIYYGNIITYWEKQNFIQIQIKKWKLSFIN